MLQSISEKTGLSSAAKLPCSSVAEQLSAGLYFSSMVRGGGRERVLEVGCQPAHDNTSIPSGTQKVINVLSLAAPALVLSSVKLLCLSVAEQLAAGLYSSMMVGGGRGGGLEVGCQPEHDNTSMPSGTQKVINALSLAALALVVAVPSWRRIFVLEKNSISAAVVVVEAQVAVSSPEDSRSRRSWSM